MKPEGNATMPVIKRSGIFFKIASRLSGLFLYVEGFAQQVFLQHDDHVPSLLYIAWSMLECSSKFLQMKLIHGIKGTHYTAVSTASRTPRGSAAPKMASVSSLDGT